MEIQFRMKDAVAENVRVKQTQRGVYTSFHVYLGDKKLNCELNRRVEELDDGVHIDAAGMLVNKSFTTRENKEVSLLAFRIHRITPAGSLDDER